MTKMNYSRNHSRSLARPDHYSGNYGMTADCIICRRTVLADGKDGRRAKVDPTIKKRAGYKGNQQAWVCYECSHEWSADLSQGILRQLEQEALAAIAAADQPYADNVDVQESESSFWKWALALGAIAVGVVVFAL